MKHHFLSLGTLIAPTAICAYIVGFVIPFDRDYPLLVLALLGALTSVYGNQPYATANTPLSALLILFLLTTALSVLFSVDFARSIQLSLALIPATLLFFIISDRLSERHLPWVFNTLLIVGITLCAILLLQACTHGGEHPSEWIKRVGVQIFKVPNDTVFLSLIAPVAFIQFISRPKSMSGIMALLFLILCLAVVTLYRSRLALLILSGTLLWIAISLIRTRAWLLITVLLMLFFIVLVGCIDWTTGFSMLEKFNAPWVLRLPLWEVSWDMFLDAPWFGNGPGSFLLLHRELLENKGLLIQAHNGKAYPITPWAHNLYLEVLAEQGIVGFISIMILLGCGGYAAWRLQSRPTGKAERVNIALCATFLGFCVGALFELSLWRQWVPITLFIILGTISMRSLPMDKSSDNRRINNESHKKT